MCIYMIHVSGLVFLVYALHRTFSIKCTRYVKQLRRVSNDKTPLKHLFPIIEIRWYGWNQYWGMKRPKRVINISMFGVSNFSVMLDHEFVRLCIDDMSDVTCRSTLLSSRRFLTNCTISPCLAVPADASSYWSPLMCISESRASGLVVGEVVGKC